MVPQVQPHDLREVGRDPPPQLDLVGKKRFPVIRDEPAKHVDKFLARLGRHRDPLTSHHNRRTGVDLRLVYVLDLVPVVDPAEKVVVAVARLALGQAVAEDVNDVDEIASPGENPNVSTISAHRCASR